MRDKQPLLGLPRCLNYSLHRRVGSQDGRSCTRHTRTACTCSRCACSRRAALLPTKVQIPASYGRQPRRITWTRIVTDPRRARVERRQSCISAEACSVGRGIRCCDSGRCACSLHIIKMAAERSTAGEGGEGNERCCSGRGGGGCLTLARTTEGSEREEDGRKMHLES